MMLWLLMDEPIAITALFGSKYSSCSFHLIRGVIVALPGWWGGPFGVVPQKTNKADWPLWAFWVELWVASCQFGSHSWLGWRLERCWDYQSWQILYQIEMQFSAIRFLLTKRVGSFSKFKKIGYIILPLLMYRTENQFPIFRNNDFSKRFLTKSL